MKRKIYSLNILIIMLAMSAGFIIFTCAFFGKLPQGVIINGENIGGKTRAEAAEIIRGKIINSLKQKSLTVVGKKQNYVFTYPEINFKDNLQKLFQSGVTAGEYRLEVSYYLNGINEIVDNICADEDVPMIEPFAVFNTEGEAFTYMDGSDGYSVNRSELYSGIRDSLNGGFESVEVTFKKVLRTKSMEGVKYDTRIISSFTTYFDGENYDRSHNIALAAEKINGTVLEDNQCFSFNQTVGKRTEERGFRTAKIIENGQFVQGVGGGVCQVSTTLFNAALLAGCTLTEFHQHSLAVSYVPPSFDAMVSGEYYDLKFENRTGHTLYIRATTNKNSVSFYIYGRGDGASYGFSSVVTGSITAPVEKTSDITQVKEGRDGTISEGYLSITRNGITKTVLYRRDKYAPVKRVELEQIEESPQQEPEVVEESEQ